jgi:hypothetical protein
MDSTHWPSQYALAYSIEVSDNGNTWTAIASCQGTGSPEVVSFPAQTAAYIKVLLLTGTAKTSPWWSMGDFKIYNGSPAPTAGSCAAAVSGTQLNESSFVASTNAPSNAPGSVFTPQNAITNAMDAGLTTTASTTRFSTEERQAPGLYFEVALSPFDTAVNIPSPYRCNVNLHCRGGFGRYGWLDGYYIYEPLRVGKGLGGGWLQIVPPPPPGNPYLPPGQISDIEAFTDGTTAAYPSWSCSFSFRRQCLQLATGDPGTGVNALSDGAPLAATNAAEAVVQGYGINANWSGCSAPPAGFYLAKGWAGDNCIAYCDPSQTTSSCGAGGAFFWVTALVPAPPSFIYSDGVTCTEKAGWANATGQATGAFVPGGSCG